MTIAISQPHRPVYHFSPPSHWMNDPNGMVYWDGEYHLFYQHNPHGTTWGPMHWGHAVSTDLIAWTHRPIALFPDELGTIFSGSAVVDREDTSGFFGGKPGLVAIFTHHQEDPASGLTRQSQSLAYSKDAGQTWTKYAGNPVLTHETCVDFRDPKVFRHAETGLWVMILACGQTVHLYTSPDLLTWTFASEFGDGIGSHDGVWECPGLFPLAVEGDPARQLWVMLVSIGDAPGSAEGSRTQYFTGSFDGRTFTADEASRTVRWLDRGRDNYAGVSWSDIPADDGRRIYIGWMSNWRYANQTPTEGWRSAMTIPRELTLETRGGELALIQRPAIEAERTGACVLSAKDIRAADVPQLLSGIQLDAYELVAEFEPGFVQPFGFKVRASADGRQATEVGYDPVAEALYVDRTRSGRTDFHADFAGRHTAGLARAEGKAMELRLLVDRCSVEVFAADGETVMTELIFPDPEAKGLELLAGPDDANAVVRSLTIYALTPEAKED
ncbi:glycoside hydrolase family 32 protein [Cohnella sp. GbtcB17]|uniref:glycoside hydrolase family 32 protein n=1 Tax=Cohnella sp. GbtcB17 TaxID=2824762 RepID=UPI001C307969|nr:glycoside hydrolase family 32 protein [Cohnella sp. GbtcB17]